MPHLCLVCRKEIYPGTPSDDYNRDCRICGSRCHNYCVLTVHVQPEPPTYTCFCCLKYKYENKLKTVKNAINNRICLKSEH